MLVLGDVLLHINTVVTGPSGRAVSGVGLWQLAFWDCEFESRWGHGYVSLL
jgi:hypothetical protein